MSKVLAGIQRGNFVEDSDKIKSEIWSTWTIVLRQTVGLAGKQWWRKCPVTTGHVLRRKLGWRGRAGGGSLCCEVQLILLWFDPLWPAACWLRCCFTLRWRAVLALPEGPSSFSGVEAGSRLAGAYCVASSQLPPISWAWVSPGYTASNPWSMTGPAVKPAGLTQNPAKRFEAEDWSRGRLAVSWARSFAVGSGSSGEKRGWQIDRVG